MADSSTYHLLQETDNEGKTFTKNHMKELRLSFSLHVVVLILLYITVVFAGALTIVILEQSPKFTKKNSHPRIYTPVEHIIEYIPVRNSNPLHTHNPFMVDPATGMPSTVTDESWEMLYNESMHTYIPFSQAARLPTPTLPVPNHENQDQYLIQLEVYHQLHCLNTIRQAIWLDGIPRYRAPHFGDFYREDGSKNYAGHGAKHIDHCLDWIRQTLLCSADTTPVSWALDTIAHKPLPQLPEERICKNMKVIDQWTREHAVKGTVDFGYGADEDL
ncbi:hypothetical protein EYC80_006078 [Monilinia laxa]|uniref:Tat pathway signal sequence n=1 Tax=Monilinia laxa TaxID=61186 RepID=A0A5N6KG24_MONLA|nr:hypothetical protein EYC80_006078 [Monilinia laxa]